MNFQVIAEEKVLPDPFLENMVKSSNNKFTARLVEGATPKPNVLQEKRTPIPLQASKNNAGIVRKQFDQTPKVPRRAGHKNVETMPPSDSSPDDMTSASSSGSSTELRSETHSLTRSKSVGSTINKSGWDVTLRPHYSNMSEAIHRIADVSIDGVTELITY